MYAAELFRIALRVLKGGRAARGTGFAASWICAAGALTILLLGGQRDARAQNVEKSPADMVSTSAAQSQPGETPKPDSGAQKPPRVTTTVVVHGETDQGYLPDAMTAGNLDGAALAETPL